MIRTCIFLLSLFALPLFANELIPMDAAWKKEVFAFANQHLQHSAWGVSHSQRNYLLAVQLAAVEKLTVDTDVLFAAAFLHDMGGFDEFKKEGVDHAVRSAELVAPILQSAGFPMKKVEQVKNVILAHTYYNPVVPVTSEETVFRDADVLDFLGSIGVARLFSVTAREGFGPLLSQTLSLTEKLRALLEKKFLLPSTKTRGKERIAEMDLFLKSLKSESFSGAAL